MKAACWRSEMKTIQWGVTSDWSSSVISKILSWVCLFFSPEDSLWGREPAEGMLGEKTEASASVSLLCSSELVLNLLHEAFKLKNRFDSVHLPLRMNARNTRAGGKTFVVEREGAVFRDWRMKDTFIKSFQWQTNKSLTSFQLWSNGGKH